jgi:carbon starvation protein
LAAQFGYLPSTIWIIVGSILAGAVQDMVILFASVRRNAKSLGKMIEEEIEQLQEELDTHNATTSI